ncbi:MAG: CpsD/CapB family tyrosine-protein kinase [Desulfobulbaceae bacterium]|nr:CpsD/CapB family tyrosine-protein kinase [Desulfobulbaceae bacterium]
MGKVFKALHKSLADEQDFGNPQDVPKSALSQEGGAEEQIEVKTRPLAEDVSSPTPRSQRITREPLREVLTGVEDWDEKLVVFSDPASPLAENFRLLRTQVLYPASGKAYKKIMITSTVPGSGKSFVCANLGISLAQGLDQHALMVDCDLRRSRLASLFNCPNDKGLVDYLQDGEDLGRLIVKTGMRKLSVIPRGRRPPNPAELLGSAKVEKMFAELGSRYDDRFILIDTPPTLAASETAVLAQHVDGVILVVRWGVGARTPIKQLVESLGQDKIIGVVFNAYEANMLSAKMSGYDEYGQYAGGYGD